MIRCAEIMCCAIVKKTLILIRLVLGGPLKKEALLDKEAPKFDLLPLAKIRGAAPAGLFRKN